MVFYINAQRIEKRTLYGDYNESISGKTPLTVTVDRYIKKYSMLAVSY